MGTAEPDSRAKPAASAISKVGRGRIVTKPQPACCSSRRGRRPACTTDDLPTPDAPTTGTSARAPPRSRAPGPRLPARRTGLDRRFQRREAPCMVTEELARKPLATTKPHLAAEWHRCRCYLGPLRWPPRGPAHARIAASTTGVPLKPGRAVKASWSAGRSAACAVPRGARRAATQPPGRRPPFRRATHPRRGGAQSPGASEPRRWVWLAHQGQTRHVDTLERSAWRSPGIHPGVSFWRGGGQLGDERESSRTTSPTALRDEFRSRQSATLIHVRTLLRARHRRGRRGRRARQ